MPRTLYIKLIFNAKIQKIYFNSHEIPMPPIHYKVVEMPNQKGWFKKRIKGLNLSKLNMYSKGAYTQLIITKLSITNLTKPYQTTKPVKIYLFSYKTYQTTTLIKLETYKTFQLRKLQKLSN